MIVRSWDRRSTKGLTTEQFQCFASQVALIIQVPGVSTAIGHQRMEAGGVQEHLGDFTCHEQKSLCLATRITLFSATPHHDVVPTRSFPK